MPRPADGCLIDVDGTVFQGGDAIPGAAAAIAALRAARIPFRFTTNITRTSRRALAEMLARAGLAVDPEEIHSAPVAAARWLASEGARRISLLLPAMTHAEFAAFELDDEKPEFVVVGDLGPEWTFERLNVAFRALSKGARLVALQRNRFWDPGDGLRLDAGPFVAALEYASLETAVIVGKPNPAFFHTAAAALGVPPGRAAAIGDDLETDVAGARAAGCVGVIVRTGKFRESALTTPSAPKPDVILDSIADLPRWLGLAGSETSERC